MALAGMGSKANWALAAVTAGYFASYPFSGTFTGGLVSSACGAAMVGGLADWFAVTALFRRPLGIPWRTDIIARNRDKILDLIATMVEQDLLTTANIMATLSRYDAAAVVRSYLSDGGGAEHVKELLATAGEELLKRADWPELSRSLEIALRREVEQIELAPLLADAIEWSLRAGYGDKAVLLLLDEARRLVIHEQALPVLAGLITAARSAYEEGRGRRKLFNTLADILLNLTPAKAAILVQQQLLALLNEWRQPGHSIREDIKDWLLAAAGSLRNDESLKAGIEAWKKEYLAKPGYLQQQLLPIIRSCLADSAAPAGRIRAASEQWFDTWMAEWAGSRGRLRQTNMLCRQAVRRWLDAHQQELGMLVRRRLEALNAAQLSSFVASRTYDDLQMIRINGSVIGGLLGLVIHVVTWWLP